MGRARALSFALWMWTCLVVSGTEAQEPDRQQSPRQTAILAINDVYRFAGVDEGKAGGLARLRSLRLALEERYPDLLVLHGGDLLAPSLISRLCQGELMVRALNCLDGIGRDAQGANYCVPEPDDGTEPPALPDTPDGVSDPKDDRMFVVFGNHEFDFDDPKVIESRILESEFNWLDTNVSFADDVMVERLRDEKLFKRRIVESGGIRIGIFGLTIPTVKRSYIEGYLDNLEAVARRQSAELRAGKEGAEVVIAVTHLNRKDDCRLLETLGESGPDLIIGGHDHDRSRGCGKGKEDVRVFKADADARTASVIHLTVDSLGEIGVKHEFRHLDETRRPRDDDLHELATRMVRDHDEIFCAKEAGIKPPRDLRCSEWYVNLTEHLKTHGEPEGYDPRCLDVRLSKTNGLLVGEETQIRRDETSLGNWVADQMRDAYRECGAQIAFVNSGSLRLNQDLPPGAAITQRHLEELVQYDAPVELIEIDGKTLQEVVDRSVQEWPGSGHWLQVSGFSFVHERNAQEKTNRATDLALGDEKRAIRPDERIRAVVPAFLLDKARDQDGYTMLSPEQRVTTCETNVASFKERLEDVLKAHAEEGIDPPQTTARICRRQDDSDCPPVAMAGVGGSRCSPCWLLAIAAMVAVLGIVLRAVFSKKPA